MGRTFINFILTIFGLMRPQTMTSLAEQEELARYASQKKCIVEIGVYHGVNTVRFKNAMDHKGTIFAVDPFPPGRLGFSYNKIISRRTVNRIKGGKVIWVRKKSAEFGSEYFQLGLPPIDFIFIDAEHTYEGLKSDWEIWKNKIIAGGIIAIHDTSSSSLRDIDGLGSVRFTKEVILRDPCFKLVEIVDSLTMLRKEKR